MDLVQVKHPEVSREDMSPEQSVSADSSSTYDGLEDRHEFLPRIGDKYQAKIPPLMIESDELRLVKDQADGLDDFYIGLPVPIVWTSNGQISKQKRHNDSVNLFSSLKQNELPAVIELKEVSEDRKVGVGDGMIKKNLENVTSSDDSISMNFMLQLENKIKRNVSDVEEGQLVVPDTLKNSWNELEVASLLLGLYIFGKNLNQVKKFIGFKQMGDILYFYYGKFYGTEKYRRWAACRKVRGKRCICGQKLFTGWRQHELSSRLLSPLVEEKRNMLVEVSRRFTEGKILLEEYVFNLKAIVGLHELVEAVGIGKRKKDLTAITIDSIKSNNTIPARPEIPVGKACSMLTPVEIVKFLTGGFRLSKARSSDLFWEAVWPRLLAKGWHSEQGNNYGSTAGMKHSLVFLIPGVNKFCRRKLVKGDQYFDSVSDVLNKVAMNPGLLELDSIVDKQGDDKEESESIGKMIQEPEGEQRYCYLKPRTPIHSTDVMNFMVVDTSLANGKTFNLRELRSLPAEIMNAYTSSSQSEGDEQISSEVLIDDSHSNSSMQCYKDVIDVSTATLNSSDKNICFDDKNCVGNSLANESPVKEDEKNSLDNVEQREIVLSQMSREKFDYETDLTNSRKWELNPCNQETSCYPINIITDTELKLELGSSSEHNGVPGVDLLKENLPLTSLFNGSSLNSCVEVPPSTCYTVEISEEMHQPHSLIDLNLPIPQNPDNFGSSTMEIKDQKNRPTKCFDFLGINKTSESLDTSECYSINNSRRQSSRNRPPTTRALEAHALGLLDVKQKRKTRDFFLDENCSLRPSQHAHAKARHSEKFEKSIVDFKLDTRESNICNGNTIH